MDNKVNTYLSFICSSLPGNGWRKKWTEDIFRREVTGGVQIGTNNKENSGKVFKSSLQDKPVMVQCCLIYF